MTCQECEIKLGMGEDAREHLAGCAECRGIARELRLNSVALLGMRAEVRRLAAGPGGPARTRASAPLAVAMAFAAAIVMGIFLRVPRVERLPMPEVRVAGAPVLAAHHTAQHRKVKRRVVPAETLRVKMFTSDPDVVIYWIVDKKEGYE